MERCLDHRDAIIEVTATAICGSDLHLYSLCDDSNPNADQAVDNCDMEAGDTVTIWGCGPVGQFAIRSAWMMGAGRVIAIDRVSERLKLASEKAGAEVVNFDDAEQAYAEFNAKQDGCIKVVMTP